MKWKNSSLLVFTIMLFAKIGGELVWLSSGESDGQQRLVVGFLMSCSF